MYVYADICAVANQLPKAKHMYSHCKESKSAHWQQLRAELRHRYNAARHNTADTGPTSMLLDGHTLHSYRLSLQVKCEHKLIITNRWGGIPFSLSAPSARSTPLPLVEKVTVSLACSDECSDIRLIHTNKQN